jgi:hypothetical protein
MKEKKKIRISIHPVEDHPGDYLAYFRSEFLDATYTVFFKDTTRSSNWPGKGGGGSERQTVETGVDRAKGSFHLPRRRPVLSRRLRKRCRWFPAVGPCPVSSSLPCAHSLRATYIAE